jgi:hypothetical protein
VAYCRLAFHVQYPSAYRSISPWTIIYREDWCWLYLKGKKCRSLALDCFKKKSNSKVNVLVQQFILQEQKKKKI